MGCTVLVLTHNNNVKALRENRFQKKKIICPLHLLLPSVWLKLCGHRRQSVLGDINAPNVVAEHSGLDSCG